MSKTYWDKQTLVDSIPYNDSETVDLKVHEVVKGVKVFIDIRKYYIPKDSSTGEKEPGKGVAIKREMIPELIHMLQSYYDIDSIDLPVHNEDGGRER